MAEIKIFRITGEIREGRLQTHFVKEIRALKENDAFEQIYGNLGSKHRVKRQQIHIISVEEIQPKDATDNIVTDLMR